MTRQIILASISPRRRELLTAMGVQFTAIGSDFDEYLDHDRPPAEVAKELGLGKARAVAEKYPEALVIGGDCIVTLDGRQLGKAVDVNEARRWLKAHAGKNARVTSSVALVCKALNLELAEADEAIVHFKPYDEAAVEAYLATGDWTDKAGAWGIQSGAAPLIAYMQGRYDTILGLPTQLLADMLKAQGIAAHAVNLQAPVPLK